MNHKQILALLPARSIIDAIDDDLTRLLRWKTLAPPGQVLDHAKLSASVVDEMLLRWNCLLLAPEDEASVFLKHQACVALAVSLHRYGFHDQALLQQADAAIDALNREVALSDRFFRQTDAIKAVLAQAPVPLKRKPARHRDQTFWRAGDVASYRLGDRFHAFYVHGIHGANVAPYIEFYDYAEARPATLAELRGCRARGAMFNDGVRRVETCTVHGMCHVPDLANQFRHLGSLPDQAPDRSHLAPPIGEYGFWTDIFLLTQLLLRNQI